MKLINVLSLLGFIYPFAAHAQNFKSEIEKRNVVNPNEPYGCYIPKKEYFKATENDPNAGGSLEDFQNYAFNHPPKNRLITLFNSNGNRIGCIINPDQNENKHKIVVIASPLPGVVESKAEIENGNTVKYIYSQDQLQTVYKNSCKLKVLEMNDEKDLFSTRKIHFKENHFERGLIESGVDSNCDKKIEERFKFYQKESLKGKVDFYSEFVMPELIQEEAKLKINPFESSNLLIIGDTTYNPRDAGNYLWGASISRSCIACPVGRAAAHYNNLKNMCKDNPELQMYGHKCRQFDSPTDQDAIQAGCHGPYNKRGVPKISCESDFQFNNNAGTSPKNEKGKFSYHLASNGSKVFEMKQGNDNHQFILSPTANGKKLDHWINGKSVSAETNLNQPDEEILSKSIGKTFPWKNDLQARITYNTPSITDFTNFIQNKMKIDCGHIVDHPIDDAKKACEASGGKFELQEASPTYFNPESNISDEKITNKINSLLKQKQTCQLEQNNKSKINLKDTYSCTCNGEAIYLGVDQCKSIKKGT